MAVCTDPVKPMRELLELLGMSTERCSDVHVHFSPDDLPTISVRYVLDDGDVDLVQRYLADHASEVNLGLTKEQASELKREWKDHFTEYALGSYDPSDPEDGERAQIACEITNALDKLELPE